MNLQSRLKSCVGSYGKLLLSWESDVGELHGVLLSLQQLESHIACIQQSLGAENHNYRIAEMRTLFPDLQKRLLHRLMLDREVHFKHLRNCRSRLGDVMIAIHQKYTEAMNAIVGESPQTARQTGGIFNFEHVLQIQDITNMLTNEHRRKEGHLKKIFEFYLLSDSAADGVQRERTSGKDGKEESLADRVADICNDWTDDAPSSCVVPDTGAVHFPVNVYQ